MAAAGIGAAGLAAAGSILNTGMNAMFNSIEAKKQREWNEQMMDKQNAWSLDMWNRTNEYNSPSAQLSRLREAGLNPLYYGLDGTSANGLESAQPLGYERASLKGVSNPLGEGVEAYLNARSVQKDIEVKNAQIDKLEAETAGVGLDNEWKDKTMDARVESEELKNSITEEQIKNFQKQRDVMEQDIKKKIAETESEWERKALLQAQKILEDAKANEIYALLPYKQNLMAAQTEAQKAAAAASWASAAYTNKMIDGGYLDSIIDKAKEDARKAGYDADTAEVNKMIMEFKASIQNGTIFAINDMKDGKTTAVSRTMDWLAGRLFQTLNITATALGAGISANALGSVSVSNNAGSSTSNSVSSSHMTGLK